MDRKFRNPELPTTDELQRLLRGEDTRGLAEALVGLALESGDLDSAYATITCSAVVRHADPGIRGAAVLCLGHLARIHRRIPEEPTLALLAAALQDDDPWVRGQAENAVSDIEVFMPDLARLYHSRQCSRKHS